MCDGVGIESVPLSDFHPPQSDNVVKTFSEHTEFRNVRFFVYRTARPLDVSFTSIHTAMPLAEVLRLQVLVMPNLQPPITTADAAAAYRSASQSCYSDATSCTKMHTADFVGARSRPYQSRFLHLIFLCRIFEIRQKK